MTDLATLSPRILTGPEREAACIARIPRARMFSTPGEARACERGWDDARRGWPPIEEVGAYAVGWFDAERWQQDRDDERADRARRER